MSVHCERRAAACAARRAARLAAARADLGCRIPDAIPTPVVGRAIPRGTVVRKALQISTIDHGSGGMRVAPYHDMHPITAHLAQHGVPLVFGNVLLQQIGVPIPAEPTLVVAGSLAAKGLLSPAA